MSGRRDVLARIAAALERLSPPLSPPVDWLSAPAYLWSDTQAMAIERIEAPALEVLRGIDGQKQAVTDNLARLSQGAAAHDMLLWGARGMGKSALIRSACADLFESGSGDLGLVQVGAEGLSTLPQLIQTLAQHERAYLLFIDDLGFDECDTAENFALRSVLDGGVIARPGNIRLAVTSNRRAIVQRDANDTAALHERDERDNALALADRFGLTLAFHPCDQDTYFEIISAYTQPLGMDFSEEEAAAWALARGNRSGRTAYQFACEIAGRAGLKL